jgi:hypothetical protein
MGLSLCGERGIDLKKVFMMNKNMKNTAQICGGNFSIYFV